MDWDDLRIFLAVARADSLSGAGRRLGVDASTVGRRVARLEAALGAKLFLKTPQGYALAPEGERLLPHAEAAEAALTGAAEALTGPGDLGGQVRIGAPDGCANYLLPQVCARLCESHPGLEIQIVALPRVFNLSRREADMAIAVSQPQAGRLVVQRLTDYHLHLAGHQDYLRRHPPIRSRADLQGHRMIGYIADMIFDRELDYLPETGADWAQLTSNSVSVQMQAIRAGAGLGIVHDFAIPFCPGVQRVLTDQIALKRSFWLIRHADDRRSQRMTRLAEALAQGLRAEVARLEALVQP
ncbi:MULTISPECIES: LysR family transcriptional regulator [unclassified Paracoccus (in: a-proteobacteria)]|uniref:LysR family transcriptional regulator n=1 Tax=unclassified Paracoccus (in: a-proteobacteria) TaxID=2688777 RepID=UPI0021E124FE|nr:MULTISPECIES: LysR family transcriptional regulator [unclassified Paracoccus (in: a-proteobacteria)]UXU74884.1 LysR family transcriptional regulator [Paracoccus sp. SMMA_5]UXU80785.1 LysR family transcriptional regulator [Paracoccus sp. SMMA_5_TC]